MPGGRTARRRTIATPQLTDADQERIRPRVEQEAQPSPIVGADYRVAARAQDAGQFPERGVRVVDPWEHSEGNDQLEAAIRERESLDVGRLRADRSLETEFGGAARGELDHRGARVDRVDAVAAPSERGRRQAGSAAGVEDRRPGFEPRRVYPLQDGRHPCPIGRAGGRLGLVDVAPAGGGGVEMSDVSRATAHRVGHLIGERAIIEWLA